VDYFLLAPLARRQQPVLGLDDFDFVRKLGEGGFGDVWLAVAKATGKEHVVKCARGFGEEEVWMNERAARACPGKTARFITSFKDKRRPRDVAAPAFDASAGGLLGAVNAAGKWAAEGGNLALLELPDLSDLAAGRLPWDNLCATPCNWGITSCALDTAP
jgi:hypothetical protein